ncbi:ATP-dependent Clp protease proteolytic subunit [Phenylobacterium sp.]|jgi:ATP-dependent protease ClpP protease subunit|uniref:ATP-dependent Clp protease proteolytic subunit n=1 Tax=Phenylobacterium sp. TaxID=1871053 RepID=UPI002F931442
MNQVTPATAPPEALARPQVRLAGSVDDAMLQTFLGALDAAEGDPLVVEITTPGGDADVGRRIATEIRLLRERTGRRVIVFGKATVYSAGVTVLGSVPPADRWLARGTMLLIHGRSLTQTVELDGPLDAVRQRLEVLLAECEAGLRLEREGFEALVAGSRVPLDEVIRRSRNNWYLDADEALSRGLIGGVV